MTNGIENSRNHKGKYQPIPVAEERIGKLIVDSAFTVHSNLGPGLLEKVYEICFCHELNKRGLSYKRQVDIPVVYDNLIFDEGLRLDVLVEDLVICELKAIENVNPVWEAQLLSHLKLTNKRLGFLINFDVGLLKMVLKEWYFNLCDSCCLYALVAKRKKQCHKASKKHKVK